ncbi:tetracycline efflux MFS transporter TetA(P) [Ktedonobacter sp. SOSP1-85]|uniref:MFS transporter n=1 Tax=Ktedonobacter sp. SOSP1-85 TaxID=2778367 RepID=UPI0019153D59|nr:MFS transporter [Ktedonobacter sp. SOSP1-85]GHO78530.1 tetracycline efflux MFS transporter TetA(P) [Ktedonobacter sp. SOSP1-85]
MQTRNSVATIYLLLRGISSLFVAVVYTVELIYQAQSIGLNPFQLVLAGMVNQLVVFVCQAPTGVLADMYSRRWAVVSGLLIIGLGFLIEGGIPSFAAVLAAQAFWGLGSSLMDGADAAWIADELGSEQVGSLYLRATQIGWLCTLPGIALGAGLGSIHLNLPMLVGGGGYLALGLLLAVIMPERRFKPATRESGSSWRQMQQTLVKGFRLVRFHPTLLVILGTGVFSGVVGEAFGRLWQYHLLHNFAFPTISNLPSITWFGVIEIVIALTNIVGIEIAKRRLDTNNQRAVAWGLWLIEGATLLGIVLFALSGQFVLALAGLWLLTTANGPRIPLRQAWINQHTPSSVRATILSFNSLVGALAAIAGGLLIGALATALTTRPALLFSGLLLLPALYLYARTLRGKQSITTTKTEEEDIMPENT